MRVPRPFAAPGQLLMLAALALLGPSCDKMPLMAPSSSTITLNATRLSIGLNGSVDITATVIESAGTPVQNGTMVIFTTTLGSIEPVEARTNNGSVTVKFRAGLQSGTAEIRASSGGNAAADALKISIGAAAAGRVELLANPTALPATGGAVQLTAIVSDASGNRLAGVPVSFSTDNGVLGATPVVSDDNGEARTTLSTSVRAVVAASVSGGTSGTVKSESLTIPVRVGPTVSISVSPTSVAAGAVVTFSVTVSTGTGGAAVRAATISFGDGLVQPIGTSGTSSIQHAYGGTGTYVVTATATDAAGETGTAAASVSVQPRVGPTVTIAVSGGSTVGSVATITVTVAAAQGGQPVRSAMVNFGDGTSQSIGTAGSSSVQHVYNGPGTYTVTAIATDAAGETSTAVSSIVVQALTVHVTLTSSPATITVGTPVEFTASASSPAPATFDRFEFVFGDGTPTRIVGPSTSTATSATAVVTHPFSAVGTYSVTVRVITTSGVSVSATREIAVQAPTMNVTLASSPATINVGTPVEFTASAAASTSVTFDRFEFAFGDGSATRTLGPSTSTATTATAVATHSFAAVGTYIVTVRVLTTSGVSGTATKEILVK